MEVDKITIKNFKCFNEIGASIEHLKQINIIIGKNNSGKSSLIEVIRYLTTKNNDFFLNKREDKKPAILFEHVFKKELIGNSFPKNTAGGEIGINHFTYGETFHDSILTYGIEQNSSKKFITIDKNFVSSARKYFETYVSQLKTSFENKHFSHLSAERDIKAEHSNSSIELTNSGDGATNLIQQIINRDIYNSDLVEKLLLKELNTVLNPDIEFSRILTQQNEEQLWEIYFENIEDGRIPLSKMGSGIKTILLVLLKIYIIPIIEKKLIKDYVFTLEELENNLHPALQRRLYYYLFEFTKKHNCLLFITTHSNIVIDLYNSFDNTQIYHIKKANNNTTISTILKQVHLKKVLDDLNVKASDILQSNGIIWVEGPSDRIYLNKWINLYDNKLIEGYHYSIMYYGGRLLSNTTFNYEIIDNELIHLLQLNTNSFVLMDRDGKSINPKLNSTKKRIQNELGLENVWITKGREIENYLTTKTLKNWLLDIYGIKSLLNNDINKKIEDNISDSNVSQRIKYEKNKNKYAFEIINFIDTDDLKVLDLNERLKVLVSIVKSWNRND